MYHIYVCVHSYGQGRRTEQENDEETTIWGNGYNEAIKVPRREKVQKKRTRQKKVLVRDRLSTKDTKK